MASLRAYLQAALTTIGLLLSFFGISLAASIETPPGGGDIPTGFATLFSWGLVGVGIGVFALGAVLLDDSGLGAYLSQNQRRLTRIGGGFLLLAAIAPFIALILLPVFYGALGPSAPGRSDTLLSALLLGWMTLAAIGGVGIVSGVGWRVTEAIAERIDDGIPGQ